jgi:hypothetical protein
MFASVSSRCCICFQLFSNVFQAFSQVFQTLVSSVLFVFFSMLQPFYLDVLKVDRAMRMGCTWEAAGSAGDVRGIVCDVRSGVNNIQGGAGPLLLRLLVSLTCYTLTRYRQGRDVASGSDVGR